MFPKYRFSYFSRSSPGVPFNATFFPSLRGPTALFPPIYSETTRLHFCRIPYRVRLHLAPHFTRSFAYLPPLNIEFPLDKTPSVYRAFFFSFSIPSFATFFYPRLVNIFVSPRAEETRAIVFAASI